MSRARAWKPNIWFVSTVMKSMETFPYMLYIYIIIITFIILSLTYVLHILIIS